MGLFNGGIFKGINKAFTKAWDINVQGTKLVGGALFPGAANILAQQEANEANRKLQEKANQQNVQLWNLQNQYNSPVEQMKRLEQAGLSPQLAYGQIADSKAGSAPEIEAPHYEAPKYSGPSALETLATFNQVVNMQEQNKQIRLNNALSAEDLRYRRYENDTLMRAGSLKGDSAMMKAGGRVGDWVRSAGDYVGKTSLFQSIMDMVGKSSEWINSPSYSDRIKANVALKKVPRR